MVQSVKKCLRKSVGRSTLSFDQLNTLLVEIKAIINSRPLTYVYSDSEGVSYALSPSHLLHGRRLTTTPNSEHYEIVSTHNSLVNRNKQQKHLLKQFLSLWRKTYLLSLREHHSIKKKQSKNRGIAVGDVVVLKNDSTKRHFWKLAVVQQLLTGSDEAVRAAIIKVVDCEGRSSLLRRSIQHLIPIEVGNDNSRTTQPGQSQVVSDREFPTTTGHDESRSSEAPVSSDCDTTKKVPSRPRRQAAVVGEINRQLNS